MKIKINHSFQDRFMEKLVPCTPRLRAKSRSTAWEILAAYNITSPEATDTQSAALTGRVTTDE